MLKRPFLVTSQRVCIPLEGPYRVEEVEGRWYVLGEHRAVVCGSEAAAHVEIERLRIEHDAHALAEEALEGLSDEFEVAARTP